MASKFRHIAKTFVVFLCLFAWLEMSNHCALAALRVNLANQKSCCSDSAKSHSSNEVMTVCCQKLQTTEQASISAPAASVSLANEAYNLLDSIVFIDSEEQIATLLNGDPPLMRLAFRIDSQRCHPAFAPPFMS